MVIRSGKSKQDRKYNDQKTKGQTMFYKTLHRKLKIEKHEPPQNSWVRLLQEKAVPAPLKTTVVLLLNDTIIK